jgi:hypothetical protein
MVNKVIQYIVVFLFFIGAISLMLAALQFSRYKKRPSGCCGGGHCEDAEEIYHSCYHEKADFVEKYKSGMETAKR